MFIATLYLANLLARVGDCTIFIYLLYWTQSRGPTRPHEAYKISKSCDFEPDFLISNLISVDF
jgi:hypothetical protein